MPSPVRAKALASFQPLPLAERWFVRARFWSAPLVELCSRAPGGTIADVGCGHGLVSPLLAIDRPARHVIPIAPNPPKIASPTPRPCWWPTGLSCGRSSICPPDIRLLMFCLSPAPEGDWPAERRVTFAASVPSSPGVRQEDPDDDQRKTE